MSFAREMAPLAGRVSMMIGRAVIEAVDDAPQAQELQVALLADELQDGVERFQGYGFTSVPHPGAEALVLSVGGLRSHAIVVQVEDRRYRLKALAPGEVAIFDDQGQKIVLKRDGIRMESPFKVEVAAPDVKVTADRAKIDAGSVDLGGAGGQPVARVGDSVDLGTGKIVSGSDVVKAT